jgi:hypothetical protein
MVGNECARTHRLIDWYSAILGKKHRTFYHDPISAMIVADVAEGPQCRAAALNHLMVDQLYTRPESKIFMEMLRLAEKPTKSDNANVCILDR